MKMCLLKLLQIQENEKKAKGGRNFSKANLRDGQGE